MTKFEDLNDPGFVAVAGELRRWAKELSQTKAPSTLLNKPAQMSFSAIPQRAELMGARNGQQTQIDTSLSKLHLGQQLVENVGASSGVANQGLSSGFYQGNSTAK